MATFVSWLNNPYKLHRFTLLNSVEPVLVEEAIISIKEKLGTGEIVNITSGHIEDAELWSLASQSSLFDVRLLVVRDSEKIKDWSPVKGWLDSCRQNNVYLLFVADLEHGTLDQELIKTLRQRTVSEIIDCKLTNSSDTVKWIKSKVKTDDRSANYLVDRSGGNLLSISNLCKKLHALEATMTNSVVDALIEESVDKSFVDALILLNKKEALLASEKVSSEDFIKILGQLTSGLIAVGKLNSEIKVRVFSEKDLAQRLGRGYYWAIRKYMPVVIRYDANKRASRFRVLAVVDAAVQAGVRDGVLESLVSAW